MGLGDFFKKNLGLQSEDEEENELEQENSEDIGVIDDTPAPAADDYDIAPKKARKTHYSDSITLGGNGKMEFVVVKPKDFGDECTGIAEHMLEKKTVVLNLETTAKDASRRIIDFVSGVAFAVKAKIRKVATCTYVIVPDNSDFAGDEISGDENAAPSQDDGSGFSF